MLLIKYGSETVFLKWICNVNLNTMALEKRLGSETGKKNQYEVFICLLSLCCSC